MLCRPDCDRTRAPYLATAGQGCSHYALPEALLALRDHAREVSNEGRCAKVGIYLHTHTTPWLCRPVHTSLESLPALNQKLAKRTNAGISHIEAVQCHAVGATLAWTMCSTELGHAHVLHKNTIAWRFALSCLSAAQHQA